MGHSFVLDGNFVELGAHLSLRRNMHGDTWTWCQRDIFECGMSVVMALH